MILANSTFYINIYSTIMKWSIAIVSTIIIFFSTFYINIYSIVVL